MSARKTQLTITVDPHVSAYAQHLVESGKATSVSAVFNEAVAEKAYRDRRRRNLWKAKVDVADPRRVSRMLANIDLLLAE
jgi:major membrane immunogen (membrane-anchored lipoprotein)